MNNRKAAALILSGCLFAGSMTALADSKTPAKPETASAGFAVAAANYEEKSDFDISEILDAVQIASEEEETKAQETEAEEPEVDPYKTMLEQFDNMGIISEVNTYLNVREEASTESYIVGKVMKYSGVDILEETEDGWYKIKSGEVEGYVASEYVTTGEEAVQLAYEHARQELCVTTEILNVREEADTNSKILTQILNSERYDIVESGDEWTEISFGMDDEGNELTGFVNNKYSFLGYYLDEAIVYDQRAIEEAEAAAAAAAEAEAAAAAEAAKASYRQQIVDFAMQYLGGAYVWGGTTLGVGVDCSGFTQAVMANFGIYLNRCSYEQVNNGTRISADQMQPGDLIFYNTSGAGISHVAIYIGNGQIIHAQSPAKGINISAWNIYAPVAVVNVIGD